MNQIHCLFTNKNEEDIQHLLQKMNLSNYTILIQLDMEKYSFEYLHTSSNKEYEFFYYNDFEDYEDEIESSRNINPLLWGEYKVYNVRICV